MSKYPAVLLILDGYGIAPPGPGNAVAAARTPYLDHLLQTWPHSRLSASGEDVGLPAGQFGNSEVGHTNLGAGRIVYQDLSRINNAIADGSFFSNRVLVDAVERCAADPGRALHLFGLLSNGGVHSHTRHLTALLELAARKGARRVYVHAFTDGRDTMPTDGADYIQGLIDELARIGTGSLATVCGRYYAMDRDSRWERLKRAYDCLVEGDGRPVADVVSAVRAYYEEGTTDEFLPPLLCDRQGLIKAGDSVIFFNFRPDRARELTRALLQREFDGFERPQGALPLCYATLTQYDETFTDFEAPPGAPPLWPDGGLRPLRVAYPPESLEQVLGEVLAQQGLTQLRLAETEKYAHVTFFFNGGREQVFEGERRILVPSPKVATYDLQPGMSAPEVAQAAQKALLEGSCDVLICNLANCDMVGHTGNYDAAVQAVEATDAAARTIVEAALSKGGVVLLTADHGNAECMLTDDGQIMTAHTSNPVLFQVIGAGQPELTDGRLCDVAPTLLQLCGIPQPAEMTGVSLIEAVDSEQ